MELTKKNRLSGSILEDKRPISEAVKDPKYVIGLTAIKIANQNYENLLASEELQRRFFEMVDSPAPKWEIMWRFGIGEQHFWSLVLNLEL